MERDSEKEGWIMRDRGREEGRYREDGGEKERIFEKERQGVCLCGFLTSSLTTRLYRGWAPRQSV